MVRIAILGLFSKDISHYLNHFYPTISTLSLEQQPISTIKVNSSLEIVGAIISKNEIHQFASIWNELVMEINQNGGCNGLLLFHSEFFETKLQIPIFELLSVSGLMQNSIQKVSGIQIINQNREYWDNQLRVFQFFPLQMLNTISLPREMIEAAEETEREEKFKEETFLNQQFFKEKLGSIVLELAQKKHPFFASLVQDVSSLDSVEAILSKYSQSSSLEQSFG